MLAEIAAFVRERDLPESDVAVLEALVAGRTRAELPFAPANATVSLDHEAGDAPGWSAELPDRYADLGPLGAGGMGEVRRVRDLQLDRACACKVLRPELAASGAAIARFVDEARVVAQLQHPNIPPVYDAGRLPDGRAWFTMKEVRGRTLTAAIAAARARGLPPALRRLGDVFAKVCDGVGYAHSRGVVHRDLKPDNVMLGAHGEVLVLDWGLAKISGRPASDEDEGGVTSGRPGDAWNTRAGGVVGTAAYMAPEQARGESVDARSDVYALGAMLYEVLAGRPPYQGSDAHAVLHAVLVGPPPDPPGPAELVALCKRCMARDPDQRLPNASAVAAEVRAWLDGATRLERALEVAAAADGLVAAVIALRARASALRVEGAALLDAVAPWAPEEDKAAGWGRQDEADRAEHDAGLLELEREALLEGALTHVPDLREAHAALAEVELARHDRAEAARDTWAAARAVARLRDHARALPDDDPVRRRVAAYLTGDGALTLHTDVLGAAVELFRYEERSRRAVATRVADLGTTPLDAVSLPMGSYLCVIRHPERAAVRYPVQLGRGDHWDGVPPGGRDPEPVRLPVPEELGPDDCFAPAGWFWSGGDPEAQDALPRVRRWADDLVVRRFQVTNREYLQFLDDLVATGREAEALEYAPRERSSLGDGLSVYGRDEAGRFVLRADGDGDVWSPDFPVILVDGYAATAYAAWFAERAGQPWRLPGELEWEKAARGVDGRFYVWGDHFDASRCRTRVSQPGPPRPVVVDSYPLDESVYGVRGLAGNAQDWCADEHRREGPALSGRGVAPAPASPDAARVLRGGYWYGSARVARCALRVRFPPHTRSEAAGIRIVRPR